LSTLMSEVRPGRDAPTEYPSSQRLDSWKEIAAYLRRGPRTVQRWEQEQGLPVHRLAHGKQGQVFAYKPELEAWWKSRQADLEPAAPAPRRRLPLVATVAALLLIAAAGVYLLRRASAPGALAALAVLPFQNLSGNPEEDFFSDGLTEEMITQLARLPAAGWRVIARTSVMPYKGTRKTIEQIGRELGVTHVLEGAVRREGDRARITAQLVRVEGQTQVWARSYDRELGGILAAQSEVAQAIAREIHLSLGRGAAARPAAARPVNPEALLAYLKGRDYYHKFTAAGFARAIELFRKAAELDPGFARAWLGLSDAYRLRGSWWGDLPPKEAFAPARAAALEALKLDPTLGEAHAGLGWIHFVYDWDWSKADAELRRGVELSPNSRDTHGPYANFLRCMKRMGESRVHIERSLALDPLSPLELTEAALLYMSMDEKAKGDALMNQAFTLNPEFPPSVWLVAYVRARNGRFEEAVAVLEPMARRPQVDRLNLALLGTLYQQMGKTAEARRILDLMLQRPQIAQYQIATLYLRLGDRQKCLEWFQRAYDERDPQLPWAGWADESFPLWNEPLFQDILRRLNLPPAKQQ